MTDPAVPRAPRWVKVFGGIALVLLALFVALHVTGRSPHGHARHSDPVRSGVP